MKSTVVVDGVTLTRTQVEKALQELNAPAPSRVYKIGDFVAVETPVLRQHYKGMVVDNGQGAPPLAFSVRALCNRAYGIVGPDRLRIIITGGCGLNIGEMYSASVENFRLLVPYVEGTR